MGQKQWFWAIVWLVGEGTWHQGSQGPELRFQGPHSGKENQFPQVVLWPPHMPWHVYVHIHTCAHIPNKVKITEGQM